VVADNGDLLLIPGLGEQHPQVLFPWSHRDYQPLQVLVKDHLLFKDVVCGGELERPLPV